MPLETMPFDTSEYAASTEAQIELLADAMETGNGGYITHVLGVVARARCMSSIARDAGVSRESLYKALRKEGDPKLSTLLGVLKAMGVQLSAKSTEQA